MAAQNKKQGRPKGRQSKPLFLFLVLLNSFGDGKLNSSELAFNPVGYTSFTRRETSKCAFLLASQVGFHFQNGITCYTILSLGETFKKTIDRQKVFKILAGAK